MHMKKWRILGTILGIELIALVCCLLVLHFGKNRQENGDKPGNDAYKVSYEDLDGRPIEETEVSDHDLAWEKIEEQTADTSEQEVLGETVEENRPITLLFAGDVLFDDQYAVMSYLKNRGGDIRSDFDDATWQVMQDADFFMLNNEFPYSDRGTPTEGKTYTFRARPEYVQFVKQMGADLVSLANNHAYDYGEEAFLDTMEILTDAGIPYVGAGHNLEEASRPYCLEMGGNKVAILAATQIERLDNPNTKGATETKAGVFRCLNDRVLLEKITECKEDGYYTIVFVHWGTESTTEIDYWQNLQGKEFAEAGADLIIGAHPHVLQGIDKIGDTPVIYSLGNYLFNSSDRDTGLFEVTLDGNVATSYRFYPARQEDCAVHMPQDSEKQRILSEMQELSSQVIFDSDGTLHFQED